MSIFNHDWPLQYASGSWWLVVVVVVKDVMHFLMQQL